MLESYLDTYAPPIPVLQIYLSCSDEEEWQGTFTAIVDTGADFTIVPKEILAAMKAIQVGSGVLSSQWRDRRSVNIYEIDLRIDDMVLPYVEVAGDPFSNELVLGRNVLNELNLRLDGPNCELHLLNER